MSSFRSERSFREGKDTYDEGRERRSREDRGEDREPRGYREIRDQRELRESRMTSESHDPRSGRRERRDEYRDVHVSKDLPSSSYKGERHYGDESARESSRYGMDRTMSSHNRTSFERERGNPTEFTRGDPLGRQGGYRSGRESAPPHVREFEPISGVYQSEIHSIGSQDNSFNPTNKKPQTIIHNLMTENKKLKDNFDLLRGEYDKLREFHEVQINQWRNSLKEKAMEFENLRIATNTSAQTLQEITQRYYEELEMRKQIEMRLDQLQNTEHENKLLLQQLKAFEREQEEMKLRMERDFMSKETILENRITRLQGQHDAVLGEKTHLVVALKSSEELLLNLEEMKAKYSQVERELTELRRSSEFLVKEKDDSIINLKRDNTSLNVHLQSLETDLQSKERKIVQLENSNHEYMMDRDSEMKRRKEAETEVLRLRAELDDTQLRFQKERNDFKRIESSQVQEITTERNALKSQVSELRYKLEKLTLQKQEIIFDHKNTDSIEVEKLKFELKTLKQQNQEANDRNHQIMQETYSKEAQYKGQIHTLESRLDSQNEKMATLRIEKEQLEVHINELKARLSMVDNELESTKLALNASESYCEEVRYTNDQLKRTTSAAESEKIKLQSKFEREQMECQSLRKQNEEQNQTIKKLKTEKLFIVDQAKSKVKEQKRELKSLQKKVSGQEQLTSQQRAKYTKRLELQAQQIESLNAQIAKEQREARLTKEKLFDVEQEWQKKFFELKRAKDRLKTLLENQNNQFGTLRFSRMMETAKANEGQIPLRDDSFEAEFQKAKREHAEFHEKCK